MLESLFLLTYGLRSLFTYNKEVFQFDNAQNQECVYHSIKMRVEQASAYRDDLRVLFELTISKMESYLLMNTVILSVCMGFFYEGRLPEDDTPAWLVCLWCGSVMSSVVFMALSVWLGIRATIIAEVFCVRMLTQWMRLPIPELTVINRYTPHAEDYEGLKHSSQIRFPMVSNLGTSSNNKEKQNTKEEVRRGYPMVSSGDTERIRSRRRGKSQTYSRGTKRETKRSKYEEMPPVSKTRCVSEERYNRRPSSMGMEYNPQETHEDEDFTDFVDHLTFFRSIHLTTWGTFDAYCRVSMVVGISSLAYVVCYTSLIYFTLNHRQWGVFAIVIIVISYLIGHGKLNLRYTPRMTFLHIVTQIIPVVCATIGAHIHSFHVLDVHDWVDIFGSISMFSQFVSMSIYAYQCRDPNSMPTAFTSVQNIDILDNDVDVLAQSVKDLNKPAGLFKYGFKNSLWDWIQSFCKRHSVFPIYFSRTFFSKRGPRKLGERFLKLYSRLKHEEYNCKDFIPTEGKLRSSLIRKTYRNRVLGSVSDLRVESHPRRCFLTLCTVVQLTWFISCVVNILSHHHGGFLGWSRRANPLTIHSDDHTRKHLIFGGKQYPCNTAQTFGKRLFEVVDNRVRYTISSPTGFRDFPNQGYLPIPIDHLNVLTDINNILRISETRIEALVTLVYNGITAKRVISWNGSTGNYISISVAPVLWCNGSP